MSLSIFHWQGFVTDKALLINRILVSSSLLVVHGMAKLEEARSGAGQFPDPFGVGHTFTFYFACFATLLCPVLIMVGWFTRIATSVALTVTLTGLLLVHAHDPLQVKDTPYIYSVALLTIFLLGPGRYSIDHWLLNKKSV
jgi:putative oxidoreductase